MTSNPPLVGSVAGVLLTALTGAGISQRQAADATGIPLTTLRRRLSGTSPIRMDELVALSALVNLTPVDIFERATRSAA